MKEDSATKELENLLREAMNYDLEPSRGEQPLVQLKTMPLDVQQLPKKPPTVTKSVAPAPPSSARAVEPPPDSIPQLADKLEAPPSAAAAKPAAAAAPPKSRASMYALMALGTIALAAAGGAAWRAKHGGLASTSAPEPTTSATAAESAEAVVGIAVSRPTEATPSASVLATSEPAPPPTTKSEEPAPPASTVAAVVEPPKAAEPPRAAEPPKAEPKPTAAEPKVVAPKPHVTVAAKPAEVKPVEKKEAKAAPSEKKEEPKPATTGGVDALLQQQLKGAIP